LKLTINKTLLEVAEGVILTDKPVTSAEELLPPEVPTVVL